MDSNSMAIGEAGKKPSETSVEIGRVRNIVNINTPGASRSQSIEDHDDVFSQFKKMEEKKQTRLACFNINTPTPGVSRSQSMEDSYSRRQFEEQQRISNLEKTVEDLMETIVDLKEEVVDLKKTTADQGKRLSKLEPFEIVQKYVLASILAVKEGQNAVPESMLFRALKSVGTSIPQDVSTILSAARLKLSEELE